MSTPLQRQTKHTLDLIESQKIYNRVDELLMEDVDYQFQLDRKQQEIKNLSAYKKITSKMQTNLTIKSALKNNKTLISSDRKSASTIKTSLKNSQDIKNNNKGEQRPKARFPGRKINVIDEKDTFLSDPDLKMNQNLKLKRTVSYSPDRLQQIKQNQLSLEIQGESNHSFIATQQGSPTALLSPGSRGNGFDNKQKKSSPMLSSKKEYLKKGQERRKNISGFGKPLNKSIEHMSQAQLQAIQKEHAAQKAPPASSQQFKLTHDELQFLSLMYPGQTPSQLMAKLLLYYEQQAQFKNSFQEIAFSESNKKKNYFFKSKANLACQQRDPIKESQSQSQSSGYSSHDDAKFIRLPVEKCPGDDREEALNDYIRLKEECLAALGSQMVQSQIKSSIVQTANVNYYTRQYAMQVIYSVIEQKNQQAEAKLQRLNQGPAQYHLTAPSQHLTSPPPSIYTSSTFPEQYIHKVYVPANSRGQCFEMDYDPNAKLFDYLSENQYRRILRDINHLIQKVLLYHRHNSFLKKNNNSLLRGWNLAMVVFLVALLGLLYVESFLAMEQRSSYIEIVSFFCLSFLLILIMGNAFNNYKKSIKRSSLIKEICEEITNYLEFANCSSKNIKWVLGKDFFWLEIWIYMRRGYASSAGVK